MGFPSGKDEAFVRRAIEQAAPNALRMALYQATGDPALVEMKAEYHPFWGGAWKIAGLNPADTEKVREAALAYLRTDPKEQGPLPDADTLHGMMDSYGTRPLTGALHRMGDEAIAFDEFPRGVEWTAGHAPANAGDFHVAIIGAGVGGIATAVQLEQLGIAYTMYERNSSVGGTWLVNNYPDARVDVASHHFQYSFVKRYPWEHYFATQGEMKAYLEQVASDYDLASNVRLSTAVTASVWDEAASLWRLTLRGPDGTESEAVANAVISAAGLFNAPNIPDIPGLDSFKGKMFHTTQWDHDYDIRGKKVGLIGTGSTGAQLMPRIAQDVGHLTIFQRSAGWITPIEGYRAPISEEANWLFDTVPYYWNWYCFGLFHMMFDDIDGLQTFDPEWQKAGGMISERNDMLRRYNLSYLEQRVGHRPDLMKKLTPNFPPMAQRPIVDNGWFDALERDNVDLVSDKIERITPNGVRTEDGVEREFDLIVLSTGFKTERYLWPVRYEGRNGVTLETSWEKDGARAYLGMTVPDFPNLFVLYGPNAQCRTGGLFTWLEIWSRYAVKSVVAMIEGNIKSMNCRRDVFETYNQKLDVETANCIWTIDGQKSYFLNEHGRSGVMLPWHPVEYFDWIYAPDLADFELRRPQNPPET